MERHKLLARQMQRDGLSESDMDSLPSSCKNLIESINQVYYETDQERYLLERSMNISSREMLDLNQKLERAQEIARLGYWQYSRSSDEMVLSSQLKSMFKLNESQSVITYQEFINLIAEEDFSKVNEIFHNNKGEKKARQEIIRFNISNGENAWYQIKADPLRGDSELLSGIAMDVTQHKESEKKIIDLNRELVITARKVGMADIATSVLHNIGNVINSSNISLGILKENFNSKIYRNLFSVGGMLKEDESSLEDYITKDEKGKLIPLYISKLIDTLLASHETCSKEISNLSDQLDYVVKIMASQEGIAGILGETEEICLLDLLDLSLNILRKMFEKHDIHVETKCSHNVFVLADQTRVLQILINLLKNAKDSLLKVKSAHQKNISITVTENKSSSSTTITVTDNGVGIDPEKLIDIFLPRYSTTIGGLGLGLHTSVLMAKDMDGSLTVSSDGVGKGASFTLTLPLSKKGDDLPKEIEDV